MQAGQLDTHLVDAFIQHGAPGSAVDQAIACAAFVDSAEAAAPSVRSPWTGGVGPFDRLALDPDAPLGSRVERDDVIAIVEAMKMENRIHAQAAGTLTALHCQLGDIVAAGQTLASITADAA
ncbi:acetyl-CoA carboxylase biotin carboxyl carrier protein subunit [Burkholderia sp. BCC1972]|uniref:acetyl-CoA carboxylase biotin carboxyl carrier protein subunit n=1 Tax=Burkholderia sp. BCC1972 TaxID=2817438 RepID=UPI002ABE3BD4|nr:biotin/lipoyl-containing protein [Burkholderia sp. BCC1972]